MYFKHINVVADTKSTKDTLHHTITLSYVNNL